MKPSIRATLFAALLSALALTFLSGASVARADSACGRNDVSWTSGDEYTAQPVSNDGQSYILDNNQWGEPDGPWATIWTGPADGDNSWGICLDKAPNNAYPYAEMIWTPASPTPVDAFAMLTTNYNQTVPSDAASSYDSAYDIWLNGYSPYQEYLPAGPPAGENPATELMVWTHVGGDESTGNTDFCGQVTIGGINYQLSLGQPGSDGTPTRIDLVMETPTDAASLDIQGIIDFLRNNPAWTSDPEGDDSTSPPCTDAQLQTMVGAGQVSEIDAGWEVSDTGGKTDDFTFNSFGIQATTTAPSLPPTAVSVAPGAADSGSATVSFGAAPATGNGGTPVTGYQVTATPTAGSSGQSATVQSSGSPVAVSGLTPGVTYTFTVAGTNRLGVGAASSATAALPATGTGHGTAPPAPVSPSAPGSSGASAGGSTTSTSAGKPTPAVKCAKPNGSLTAARLGAISLGESFAKAKQAYPCEVTRSGMYSFTLTQGGIRVAEPAGSLLRKLSASEVRRVKATVTLALTWSTHYSVDTIRVGSTLSQTEKRFSRGVLMRSGSTEWYFWHSGTRTLVFEFSRSRVAQLGLAAPALTATSAADAAFLKSL